MSLKAPECKVCGATHSLREPHVWRDVTEPEEAKKHNVTALKAPINNVTDWKAKVVELEAKIADLEAQLMKGSNSGFC